MLVRFVGTWLLGAALAWPARASAQPEAPPGDGDCNAVLTGALDEELIARIRGQSRDVPCTLTVRPGQEPASLPHQHVDATLSIRGGPAGGYALEVREHGSGTVHTRAVPAAASAQGTPSGPRDALTRSAELEALALVVRSELLELQRAVQERLRALRVKSTFVPSAGAADASAQRSMAARMQSARDESAAGADAEAASDRSALDADSRAVEPVEERGASTLLLGYELADIGVSAPAHALAARALFDRGHYELGVGATYGFAAPLDDSHVRALVQRHSLYALALWPAVQSRWLRVELAASAGVALLERTTRVRDATLVASGDRSAASLLVGLEAGLALAIAGPLALRASLGLDLVPAAPRYAYEQAGSVVERAAAQLLQPRAGLALTARFR